jgi:hypothetical protein
MREQFIIQPCGGMIQHTGKPQEVVSANPNRIGGYVGNSSDHVLHVNTGGHVIEVQPWRGIMLGDWQGRVSVTGTYETRFSAAEFVKP